MLFSLDQTWFSSEPAHTDVSTIVTSVKHGTIKYNVCNITNGEHIAVDVLTFPDKASKREVL